MLSIQVGGSGIQAIVGDQEEKRTASWCRNEVVCVPCRSVSEMEKDCCGPGCVGTTAGVYNIQENVVKAHTWRNLGEHT